MGCSHFTERKNNPLMLTIYNFLSEKIYAKNVKNDGFNFFLKTKEMLKQIHVKCYEQLMLSF